MKTNPCKMNMETADLSTTEWIEKLIIISKEELSQEPPSDDEESECLDDDNEDNGDNREARNDDDDDSDDSDDSDKDIFENERRELKARYDLRMTRMAPLFASQPRLEKICKDQDNEFLHTCFTEYSFYREKNDSAYDLLEKENDLEYVINLCGSNLTRLDVREHPTSEIMPIIKANCPNLERLSIGFKKIRSQDFSNIFSNMSHLRNLHIEWVCENSTLPITLAKSLEEISGALKFLSLVSILPQNIIFFPDLFAPVFPRLTALKILEIFNFGLSQPLIQSIGQINSLEILRLENNLDKNHPMYDARINMYPIGNLKNLEKLMIRVDYGIRDEFLINLCNNAKNLKDLELIGSNITDIGMSAINNLKKLSMFDLGVDYNRQQSKKNEYITDESIQCLTNQKLQFLTISNCIKITDKSVIKLAKNLPKLIELIIRNVKISSGAVRKAYKLRKQRKTRLFITYDDQED